MSQQKMMSDPPLQIRVKGDRARVRVEGEAETHSFRLRRVPSLTAQTAEVKIVPEIRSASEPILVSYARASRDGREVLRQHKVSFIGDSGECFIYAPPLYVDRAANGLDLGQLLDESPTQHTRNPFALRASRVLRWLLLNPTTEFTVGQLAEATSASPAVTSRVLHSAHDEAWIDFERDTTDGRTRRVKIRRPLEMLSAWQGAWERRRIFSTRWSIQSPSPDQTLAQIQAVAKRYPDLKWAVGGLAGAAQIRRAVEPSDVLLWLPKQKLAMWQHELNAVPMSRGSGELRMAAIPDEYLLNWVRHERNLAVADPVQLWLDCSTTGERALEAADAVAQEMGW